MRVIARQLSTLNSVFSLNLLCRVTLREHVVMAKKRKAASQANPTATKRAAFLTNPDKNHEVKDGPDARRPSPDALPVRARTGKPAKADRVAVEDPESDFASEASEEEEVKQSLSRPPPVNSSYLPLPWKGRLGYVSPHHSLVNQHC